MKYIFKVVVLISIIICGVGFTIISNAYFIIIRKLVWEFKLPSSLEIMQFNEYEQGDIFKDKRNVFYRNFLFYLIEYKPYYKSRK